MERLKQLLAWLKKHQFLLKIIFFASVLGFVANQFAHILQGMSFQQLKDHLKEIPLTRALLMIVVGLLGSFAMVGYDAVGQKALEKQGQSKTPIKTWLPYAIIINGINNLVGFGGVVGATLRGNFYQKELNKGKVLGTVSKMAFFILSGLSLFSFLSFLALFIFPIDHYFRQYWIWLLGGSFYLPLLLLFANSKRQTLFKEFYPVGVYQLVGASFLQWGSSFLTFLVIGKLMNLSFSVLGLVPLYFATSLIGMLTMVPGGAGTFDVLMLMGLSQMGLSKEVALLWLLYYRLSYYLLPFLLSGFLFIRHTGVKMNQFFNGLPKILSQKTAHFILTGAVYFAGIMMILLATVTNLAHLNSLFSYLMPFSFNLLDQTLNILVGVLLLGLGRGVYNKVAKAYWPTVILLIVCIATMMIRTVDWLIILFYLLILFALYHARKEFYRKKLVYSFGGLAFDSLLFTILLILYSIAGVYSQKSIPGEVVSGHFILFPSSEVWFKGILGLGLALFALITLISYLKEGPELENDNLTKTSYTYPQTGRPLLYFPFVKSYNKLFVNGNPKGESRYWTKGILRFMKEADKLGYQVVFYNVSTELVSVLHDLGFDYLKIGEEGYYQRDSLDLVLEETEEYYYQRYDKLTLNQLTSFQQRMELEDIPVLLTIPFAALFKDEKIVGVITENFSEVENTFEILASYATSPENYALLLNYYLSHKKPQEKVDLGLLPLANVGVTRFSFLVERVLQLIYRYGLQNTSGMQQRQVKENFATKKEKRYLAYSRQANGTVTLIQLYFLLKRELKEK